MFNSIFVCGIEYEFKCWYWNGDYTIKTFTYISESGHEIYREYKE